MKDERNERAKRIGRVSFVVNECSRLQQSLRTLSLEPSSWLARFDRSPSSKPSNMLGEPSSLKLWSWFSPRRPTARCITCAERSEAHFNEGKSKTSEASIELSGLV